MITYVDFSLFDSPARVIVNTVNTVGVMGKGVAKEFKRVYPEMFAEYQKVCEAGQFNVGHLFLYKTSHKWVLNFPTKKDWRNRSQTAYVEAGLRKFVDVYRDARITSISFPQLGCGNGDLEWKSEVKPLMERYLRALPIQIFIHIAPTPSSFKPEHRDPDVVKKWLRAEPRSLPFTEVWDDLVALARSVSSLRTLDGSEEFQASFVDETVALNAGDRQIDMHKDDLRVLWQQIRDLGLCIPSILPNGLDRYSRYVLPLLAELPYLTLVRQADRDSKLTRSAFGLLLKAEVGQEPEPEPMVRQLQLV